MSTRRARPDVDAVVVGAGMSGLYMLQRLRGLEMSAIVLEAADDVGGTWYWNRYPGARCDIQSIDYSYSWDPELDREWQWSEKYATQPEILSYLQHVADKHDLRRDVRFSTRLEAASWDEEGRRWLVRTDRGDEIACRHLIMATGCLSMPKSSDIPGVDRFTGASYWTSSWPRDGVDFTGKRVAVIGTGSSGVQSIPIIAREADRLTVFQRTPNFSMPAGNGPVPREKAEAFASDREGYRERMRWTRAGVETGDPPTESALLVPEDERLARYEAAWQAGELLAPGSTFNDLLTNPKANETWAEFVRDKIRSIVDDPDVAELLCPTDHPFGSKRACLDTNYYQTFNLPHVRLVDLRATPIDSITEAGIDTTEESFELDAIVYATGFDAMTGALVAVDVTGRDGVSLRDKWTEGPKTYLGLTTVGFPNFFMITGPGSPSVLSNMVVSIEQHVDWIADCLADMREHGHHTIEPTETAESGWVRHVNDCADITLFPRANSWYIGANVPGKPRVFLPYVGGVDTYRRTCDEVVERDYFGFVLDGPGGWQCHDGVVNRLQPDVALLLRAVAALDMPTMDTLPVEEARAAQRAMAAQRPPGPDVGEIVDGSLPGPAGELSYRLYRPPTPGSHPVVVYFHGGGWVLGAHDSDDPFCRDLCVRSDALIVSVDYRHAPEARFPAAVEDAFTALQWVSANAEALGGDARPVAVAGWSAGGTLAAVVCQMARDAGAPDISGQLLVAAVTDDVGDRPSYVDNAEGYLLTKDLMDWFWNHYADPEDRRDPAASPLRAESLADLPPAAVFTAEFDPLRDEGAAYADALAAAGVDVRYHECRGHIHTSLLAVDVILSGAPIRAEMAEALRGFFDARVMAAGR